MQFLTENIYVGIMIKQQDQYEPNMFVQRLLLTLIDLKVNFRCFKMSIGN